MNAPVTPPTTPPYHHTPLFPLGPDETPYRKFADKGARMEKAMGRMVGITVQEFGAVVDDSPK